MIEQPASSLMRYYFRFEWMAQQIKVLCTHMVDESIALGVHIATRQPMKVDGRTLPHFPSRSEVSVMQFEIESKQWFPDTLNDSNLELFFLNYC